MPATNNGRIANPDLYQELYLAGTEEAAIAETFGRLPIWKASDFVHANGRTLALATYTLAENTTIFDLNDVEALKRLGIAKPTDVVTRDRKKSQAWSRAIFHMSGFDGASWWSYYNPDWPVYGVWSTDALTCTALPEALSLTHPAVKAAAAAIVRQIV